MTTLTPSSSTFKNNEKRYSLAFHTPAFTKEAQPDHQIEYDEKPSRKKVLFTPKLGGVAKDGAVSCHNSTSTQAFTSCASSSTGSIRTSCKDELDTQPSKEVKKNISMALDMTPSTANKKASKEEQEKEKPAQKYGKRKIEYYDTDEELELYDGVKGGTEEGRKSKQLKLMTPTEPKVSKVYLYNSTKTHMYCFPVYLESDLKLNKEIQDLLKDADIDNDCETENEILTYSIYQAKKDLAEGIKRQRAEEMKQMKPRKANSFEERLNSSHDSGKKEQEKDDAGSFWAKVSGSFKDLLGQSSRKSL